MNVLPLCDPKCDVSAFDKYMLSGIYVQLYYISGKDALYIETAEQIRKLHLGLL